MTASCSIGKQHGFSFDAISDVSHVKGSMSRLIVLFFSVILIQRLENFFFIVFLSVDRFGVSRDLCDMVLSWRVGEQVASVKVYSVRDSLVGVEGEK